MIKACCHIQDMTGRRETEHEKICALKRVSPEVGFTVLNTHIPSRSIYSHGHQSAVETGRCSLVRKEGKILVDNLVTLTQFCCIFV